MDIFLQFIFNLIYLIIGVVIGTYIATKYVVVGVVKKEIVNIIHELRETDGFNEEISKIIDNVLSTINDKGKKIADDIVSYILDKYFIISKDNEKTKIPKPPRVDKE